MSETRTESPRRLKQFYVEALFPVPPLEVGLKPDQTRPLQKLEVDDTLTVEVVLFQEDGRVLGVVTGAFPHAVAAHDRAVKILVDLLGDLGSNAATAGLLAPVRVNVLDICGYSRDLQQPAPTAPEKDRV